MFSSISTSTPSLALLLLTTTAQLATAVSTVTLTQSAAPTATSTSFTSDDTFEKDMLDAHNFYRGEHNASALSWNASSASVGEKWSSACNFVHSGGPTGENLAAGYANASASVDAWGLERGKYNWKSPGFSEATGHFTQLVWRNTTSVGCGRTSCGGKNGTPGWYVVCEYYPPGNVEGSSNQFFKDNVKVQSKGKKTDTVESGVSSAGVGG
ncbi:Repressed by EFG1 protein, partial [Lachnellula willkommii]